MIGLGSGMSKNVLAIGALMLAVFVLAIITGVFYIGMDELKEVACETADATYVWNQSDCYMNATDTVTVTAVTRITTVEAVALTILGLVSLIVVVALFALVIKSAIGFAKGL